MCERACIQLSADVRNQPTRVFGVEESLRSRQPLQPGQPPSTPSCLIFGLLNPSSKTNEFCGGNDTRTSHVDVWPSGVCQDQASKALCRSIHCWPNSCFAGKRRPLFGDRRLGLCFLSTKGKQPRVRNMLVEVYLRPAAAKAGIFHRIEMTAGECGGRSAAGSISQPSPQSRIVLGSHQNRSKTVQTLLHTAMSN